MDILSTTGWKDYELIDSGNGLRLERFGPYKTVRPDPQAIWQPTLPEKEWNQADVLFVRTHEDKGRWQFKRHIPEKWKMTYKNLSFWARLTSFKHTGVFPEQSLQWDWISNQIKLRLNSAHQNSQINSDKFRGVGASESQSLRPTDSLILRNSDNPNSSESIRHNRVPSESHPGVLNLFGYTGIASLAAAAAGAKVTHVDASKPSVTWARDNQKISGLEKASIRWILDDAVKFVEREIRRGNTYDGIIMDPPVYGHGPTGQIWKFNEDFPKLMELCSHLLSQNPLFVVVNAYAISSSSLMLENVVKDFLPKGLPAGRQGKVEVGELCLQESAGKRLLSTGIYARWTT